MFYVKELGNGETAINNMLLVACTMFYFGKLLIIIRPSGIYCDNSIVHNKLFLKKRNTWIHSSKILIEKEPVLKLLVKCY